jgi:Cellulase (glycosyl hydrolase family 5)
VNAIRHGLATVAALLALALTPAAYAGGPSMLIGATEDSVRSSDPVVAQKQMDLIQAAGFRAVRITDIWAPGETSVSKSDATILANVVAAAKQDGIEVFISVLNYGSKTTPLTPTDQADFAKYAASVVTTTGVRHLIVGNEPNLNRYWLPQFDANGGDAAAAAYETLLAQTYDTVKAANPNVEVIGGALAPRGGDVPNGIRPTHSPTAFLTDMGADYRASGRTAPIMDALAIHPYEDHSSVAPADGTHPNTTTIALADYDKLVSILGTAFDGTAQLGTTLPIYYDEFGVESQIPPAKQSLYTGTEPAVTEPVTEATQAAYYRQAVQLAFCQPTVRGLFLFHAVDEKDLAGWQSGVYYPDDTPKTSLPGVRFAIRQSLGGVIASCPGLQITPTATVVQHDGVLTLRCNVDCNFVAQLYRVPGKLLASVHGQAVAGTPKRLMLPVPKTKGSYRLRLSAVAPVNRGKAFLLRQPLKPG